MRTDLMLVHIFLTATFYFSAAALAQTPKDIRDKMNAVEKAQTLRESLVDGVDPELRIHVAGEMTTWLLDAAFREIVIADTELMELYQKHIESAEFEFSSRIATVNYGTLVAKSGQRDLAYDFVIKLLRSPAYGTRRKAVVILNTLAKEGQDVSNFLSHKGATNALVFFFYNGKSETGIQSGLEFINKYLKPSEPESASLQKAINHAKNRLEKNESARKGPPTPYYKKACDRIFKFLGSQIRRLKPKR